MDELVGSVDASTDRSRYDFFNESMLDQGSQYRYAGGFEGAARDPLQHALPLVLMAPERAASVLRMALSQLVPKAAWGAPKPAGPYAPADDAWNTPYALYGSGRIEDPFFGVNLSGASDLELYLLLLASEYLFLANQCISSVLSTSISEVTEFFIYLSCTIFAVGLFLMKL